jgi:hypothetical protein
MYFDMKSYLKYNHYYTAKHTISSMEFCVLDQAHTNPRRDLKNNASDA